MLNCSGNVHYWHWVMTCTGVFVLGDSLEKCVQLRIALLTFFFLLLLRIINTRNWFVQNKAN